MKLPASPPKLIDQIRGMSPELMAAIVKARFEPTINGAYLHWDELRRREAPEGFTHEQWWLGIALARQGGLTYLPLLRDKAGRSLTFATPEPVLIHLHHMDQESPSWVSRPVAEVSTPMNRDEYVLRSLIEESITSSQLEGASTTRRVAEDMLRAGRQPRNHDERMIFNNFRTMRAIQAFRDDSITPKKILELHRLVTEDTLDDPKEAGRLRQSDDINVIDVESGIILHRPPAFLELKDRMERLCAFANASESQRPFVHPVIRAILLHFMLAYDHPFVDGNGRTARALFYWSMLKSGYWLTEFISISRFLRHAPAQYRNAYLHTEFDEGNTTYFLIHQLDTIQKAIDALHGYLKRRQMENRVVEALIRQNSKGGARLNHRQRALLSDALKHPGQLYRIAHHQGIHGVVYQTARADLLLLAQLGLLDQGREGKAMTFKAPANLRSRLEKLK
jgi:Fic family protein